MRAPSALQLTDSHAPYTASARIECSTDLGRDHSQEPDLDRQSERTTIDERSDASLLRDVQSGDDAALATLITRKIKTR